MGRSPRRVRRGAGGIIEGQSVSQGRAVVNGIHDSGLGLRRCTARPVWTLLLCQVHKPTFRDQGSADDVTYFRVLEAGGLGIFNKQCFSQAGHFHDLFLRSESVRRALDSVLLEHKLL